jgi:AcrR family transcriptional regulator
VERWTCGLPASCDMEETTARPAKELSLRERKKLRTRQQIADAALALFAAKGYDAVTVAEIARMADVSEQTVYNFFPSKEQLVLDEDAALQAFLVRMVRDRPAGTPLSDAVRSGAHALLDDLRRRPKGPQAAGSMPYLINTSPALRRAWLEALERYAGAMADVLVEDGKGTTPPVAKAIGFSIAAVFHMIIDEIGKGMKRGTKDWPALMRSLHAHIDNAVDHMAHGLNAGGST